MSSTGAPMAMVVGLPNRGFHELRDDRAFRIKLVNVTHRLHLIRLPRGLALALSLLMRLPPSPLLPEHVPALRPWSVKFTSMIPSRKVPRASKKIFSTDAGSRVPVGAFAANCRHKQASD